MTILSSSTRGWVLKFCQTLLAFRVSAPLVAFSDATNLPAPGHSLFSAPAKHAKPCQDACCLASGAPIYATDLRPLGKGGLTAALHSVRPSSNSGICKRLFVREVVCREHGRLRGRYRSPQHGASRDSPSNVCLARSERTRGATVLTEWTSLRPGRDASSRQWRSRACELGVRCLLVEQFT